MQEEVAEVLDLKHDGVYVDATIGPGGHTAYLLERIGSEGKIIGIDRDEEALEASAKKFAGRGVCLKRGKFSDMEAFIRSEGITEVDGILFDLGISMLQLKNQTRGFSFLTDARLDMRMDSTQEVSAWDIVNTYPEKQLEKILREYGEERFARKIAKAIVQARHRRPIDSCAQLSEIVRAVYRKRGRIHPATRTSFIGRQDRQTFYRGECERKDSHEYHQEAEDPLREGNQDEPLRTECEIEGC
jgi:16S rRNA (cytosine1402-N4)-methyltransferase